ncbi:GntR family transcriptional regulator [Streptomyces sp. NPDC048305]|uniref:GntR family transcriptional regulator n=1 Tax=Streptomyces sp. NPDC048305 TaxID=3365532 RepID=UPI00371A467D
MTRPSAKVYEELRRRILSGEHAPGEWLREGGIATALEVSRTPVRDALRQLQADGLVELHPNRGAQVIQFDSADLDDIFTLRALLEGHAARRAAERELPTADLDELRTLCAEMEELEHVGTRASNDRITELNMEFHRALHRASGNALLPGVLSGVIQISLVRHTFHHYAPVEMRRSLRQHRDLVDAIEAGDGTLAEAVMTAHVLSARTSLRRRRSAEGAAGGSE